MPELECGRRDPLPCNLARWCPHWDGPRPEPVQQWECPGQFGDDGKWKSCCQETA